MRRHTCLGQSIALPGLIAGLSVTAAHAAEPGLTLFSQSAGNLTLPASSLSFLLVLPFLPALLLSAAELAARASLREDFFLTSSKLLVTFEKDYAKRTYEDFLEYGNAEYSFHCGIAKASGNKRLAKIMAELMNQYRRFHYVTFQKSPWLKTTGDQHLEILEAIRLHQPSQAHKLMYEHIQRGSQRAFQLALGSLSGEESQMASADKYSSS